MSEATRAWIYRVIVAAVALLGIYGLVEPDQAESWLAVAFAVLGLASSGLASANTSTKSTNP